MRVVVFLWSELIRVQFYFILIFLFDPSWSESIRVDPTRTGGPSWSGPTFIPSGNGITEAETGTETEHGTGERRFQEIDLEKNIY